MRSAVEQYTARTAELLPSVTIDPSVTSKAQSMLGELRRAVAEKQNLQAEFTEQEVQALIDQSTWRDWVRIGLNGEEATVRFSFPLAALGDWEAASFVVANLKERFLVGDARGRFGLSAGKPTLSFSHLVLNDNQLEDLPRGHAAEWVLGAVSHSIEASPTEEAVGDSPISRLRNLREVSIRDSRLVVVVGQ